MKISFPNLRFILFTKSYAGFYLLEQIKCSEEKRVLLKRLSRTLLFKQKCFSCFLHHRPCPKNCYRLFKFNIKNKKKINVYLKIENELITLFKIKVDRLNFIDETYEKILLKTAIERTAGNSLHDIENDREFDQKLVELEKTYYRWYYEIAYKYRLPTLRIIPFLVRLIFI